MLAKRVIYITASEANIYLWKEACLQGPEEFRLDQDGLKSFSSRLSDSEEMLTYLIVDVVEEEFRNETVPHLFGRERKEFINRRLDQYYRATPYRGSLIQGREEAGRRDDRILFTALTNPDVVNPWVECLLEHKVPIAGIYTPSVLGGDLLQKLGINSENVLLMTRQKNSGVRQSYFQGKQLKLSRLVPIGELNEELSAELIFSEIEKARRYLARLQLLPFDKALDVCVIGDSETIEIISDNSPGNSPDNSPGENRDADLARLHVFNIDDLFVDLGIKQQESARFCDQIYSRLLITKAPALNYTGVGDARYRKYRQNRLAMYAASVVFFMASLVWGGMNFIEGGVLESKSQDARKSAAIVQSEYDMVVAKIPETSIRPDGLKESVEIAKILKAHKALPQPLLKAISMGFNDASLKMDSIEWVVTSDPDASVDSKHKDRIQKVAIEAAGNLQSDNTEKLYQVALVKGSFEKFSGDYRKAFDAVNNLASRLKGHADIINVQAIRLPLDVSSSSNLAGQTGIKAVAGDAVFVLRVVLEVRHGQG